MIMSPSVSLICMENSTKSTELQALSPCSSGRRSNASNSSEFEFCMVPNPSSTQLNLLSADELFVDGVLLPLHLLHLHPNCDPPDKTSLPRPDEPSNHSESEPPVAEPEPGTGTEPSPTITESTASVSASKRWKDLFKKGEKKHGTKNNSSLDREREKAKRKERNGGIGGSSGAELNINLWPFARSRSAGNAGTRPKMFPGAVGTRKVNSAPCSRSNSAGQSKSRKWPSSPNRPGVHLGRSSPVWQVKRCGSSGMKIDPERISKAAENGVKNETPGCRRRKTTTVGSGAGANGKGKVLNLNVPMCIGYRSHLRCGSEESGTIGSVDGRNGGGCDRSVGNGTSNGNIFNLLNLFTKKSVLTSH